MRRLTGNNMERATFCEHYQIANQYDGSPTELGRFGPAVIYKASDLRTGAPVALTLLPIESVDPAARDRFEEHVRVAQQLDHANIAKIVAFGATEDRFAFVSEYPQGETLEAWVAAHGPMPADAVLRVALQVMSALTAASFVALTHPAIQPSNLIIVSGRTAEGGWPSVKVLNFGLAGLELATKDHEKDDVPSEFASPEQLQRGTTDFRSAIYSLGATMCFLLTGAFYSAEPRSRQTRRFARPLRRLITPMLRQDPDERPQDPILFTQAVRACLGKVERRQALARNLGLTFVATKPTRARQRPHPAPVPLAAPIPAPVAPVAVTARPHPWISRRAMAVAAVLFVVGAAAALLLPAPVSLLLHRNRDAEPIGVPVGIPESSAMAMARNSSSPADAVPSASSLGSPTSDLASPPPSAAVENKIVASNNRAIPTAPIAEQPPPASSPATASTKESLAAVANQPASGTPPLVTPATAADKQITEQQPATGTEESASITHDVVSDNTAKQPTGPAEGPQTVWERETGTKQKLLTHKGRDEENSAATSAPEQTNKKSTSRSSAARSKSRSKSGEVASNRRRSGARYDGSLTEQTSPDQGDGYRAPYQPYEHRLTRARRALPAGSFRAQVVGTTPEGGVILRLPSGEIAIVPPRHRPRRILIERPPYFVPPPRPEYGPVLPPDA
jgi:serine/threonine protein kinase